MKAGDLASENRKQREEKQEALVKSVFDLLSKGSEFCTELQTVTLTPSDEEVASGNLTAKLAFHHFSDLTKIKKEILE